MAVGISWTALFCSSCPHRTRFSFSQPFNEEMKMAWKRMSYLVRTLASWLQTPSSSGSWVDWLWAGRQESPHMTGWTMLQPGHRNTVNNTRPLSPINHILYKIDLVSISYGWHMFGMGLRNMFPSQGETVRKLFPCSTGNHSLSQQMFVCIWAWLRGIYLSTQWP